MIRRTAVLALVCSTLAACSGDKGPLAGAGLSTLAVAPVSTGTLANDAEALEAAAAARVATKRSMASKMLSAIALERVTGRKPDPARFAELR